VEVLALAVQDTKADMKAFIKKYDVSYPVALAGDDVAAAYGLRGVPTLFVLDSNGKIIKTYVGGTDAATLASVVDDLTD
jgi:cytochrome oxidase Cu insertion factor (SCO1/SenC/PrrC family)